MLCCKENTFWDGGGGLHFHFGYGGRRGDGGSKLYTLSWAPIFCSSFPQGGLLGAVISAGTRGYSKQPTPRPLN